MKPDSSLLFNMMESRAGTAGTQGIQFAIASKYVLAAAQASTFRHVYNTGIILLGSPFTLSRLMCNNDQLNVANPAYYTTTAPKWTVMI